MNNIKSYLYIKYLTKSYLFSGEKKKFKNVAICFLIVLFKQLSIVQKIANILFYHFQQILMVPQIEFLALDLKEHAPDICV